jgi:hypothetical protein
MKPIEILKYAMAIPYIVCNKYAFKGPRKIIERLSKEKRKILSKLTSDDLAKERVEWWELEDEFRSSELYRSKLKTDFDKKMRK